MICQFRSRALGLLALFVAASAVLLSQGPRAVTSAASKMADAHIRDLAPAKPESVGISAERLSRLDAAMKRLVDEKQVAGLVTLVERHGKVVQFDAIGQLDVRTTDRMQKDSIFRIYSMTKP